MQSTCRVNTQYKRAHESTGRVLSYILFFLINIKDLVNSSTILSFVLIADDTTVYVHNDFIDDAIQILNTELYKVASWLDSNKLTLNVNKTQMIMLSPEESLTAYNEVFLRNEVVEREIKAKFLGVIVDQHP